MREPAPKKQLGARQRRRIGLAGDLRGRSAEEEDFAAAFREGTASVTMERAIFGYSIFTTIDFAPQSSGGKAGLKATAGYIGRMPIHPEIAKFMNYLFLDLWDALDHERKLAARLTSAEFHDKSVVLLSIP